VPTTSPPAPARPGSGTAWKALDRLCHVRAVGTPPRRTAEGPVTGPAAGPVTGPAAGQVWCRPVRLVPTGTVSLVVDLAEDGVWRAAGGQWHRTPGAAVGGAYAAPFTVDSSTLGTLVVVRFRPGGAAPFVGVPLDELAGTHVSLRDLWGPDADRLREQLLRSPTPAGRRRVVADALLARLTGEPTVEPSLAVALAALEAGSSVAAVVERLGVPAARFNRTFRAHVGLTPQRYARSGACSARWWRSAARRSRTSPTRTAAPTRPICITSSARSPASPPPSTSPGGGRGTSWPSSDR